MRTEGHPRRHVVIMCVVTTLLGCGLLLQADSKQEAAVARQDLVRANTRFAFDVYHELATETGNLFFSPYSLSIALAMTYAGARGATEGQMAEALRFTLSQSDLHSTFGTLNTDLVGWTKEIDSVRLSIANALWGQHEHPFLPEFLDLLETSYGAPLLQTDFAGNPEGARCGINDWVSEKTERRIEDLLAPGSITPETRLVLANAIYFLGTWKHPFDEELTQDAPFHRHDGTEAWIPMMVADASFHYTEGDNVQAIELGYAGDRLSMLILLPDQGMFGQFEAAFSVERLDAIVTEMRPRHVWLAMPRFELTSEFCLAGVLADLGMPDAFSAAADFSGMDGAHNLFIGRVAHKAFVSVNEDGTEAAAATGVIMTLSLPRMVRVDRPFLFLIRDVGTGTILFLGRVMDPSTR